MGYTHYWRHGITIETDKFSAIVEDIRKVVDESGVPMEHFDVEADSLAFNGAEDYETFVFNRIGTGFGFCKTAQKPYDICVVAALIVAKHHLGDQIEVSSDGSPSEWKDGLTLVRDTLGYGDFPYDEKRVMDDFCEPYNKEYLKQYRSIRKAFGLPDDPPDLFESESEDDSIAMKK